MKKIIAMLLALVMVLGLAACASKTEPAQTEEPAATETTPAAEETTEETTEEPAETTEEPATTEATGSLYYLNFKPEADEAWQKLAATYTEQTWFPSRSSPLLPAPTTPPSPPSWTIAPLRPSSSAATRAPSTPTATTAIRWTAPPSWIR